jgi:hypothetical protein
MVRPARLERATSWFVAVNPFVDPAQLTARRTPKRACHLDPMLDPDMLKRDLLHQACQRTCLGEDDPLLSFRLRSTNS